ncbi:hypothetical protein [Rhodobacter capsulatus]|jgi:hypothetical protein|uniref:Colicin transporter n=1 Tax=Rhodobacter capsulatus (strain ATCC BAA-309 / NBRC 16581 / SB1003) TaxID=272942 RepID=D5AV93_RHOCB|nr:hypothetical protein [Rhodobacter capsulatus]ADE85875.1 conserved hypothetical protein [Rhodobacter capsulatus SB 1003]ETD00984.1 hypothetical protein U714_12045 [Rhodobacter capsulatus DE442]ETD76036.1 hypothetical protein U717_12205 [Rhodobacter capsulatus R121]ETE53201.1 hypothetical protein U715_12210 [Rhodobacter capsulatus Y262]MDS0927714.1 hypothetical protein [Rhodobacter capsulatus]
MTELAEYERRIAFALERIGRGVETLGDLRAAALAAQAAAPAPEPDPVAPVDLAPVDTGPSAEVLALQAELEAERAASAQLTERVLAIREKQETMLAALEKRLSQATRALEAVQVEANRLKRANNDLIEVNRQLIDGAGRIDPALVNLSMQAELEALRAARAWEASELSDIVTGLAPIVAAHVKGQPAGGSDNG